MKLLSGSYVLGCFQLRSHRNMGWRPLPELPLWLRYYAKNHSAFLQNVLSITSNIMKLLSRCLVLAAFQLKIHRNTRRHPLPRYNAKNYSAFFQNFVWITYNIMKHLFESQNSSARIFSKLFNINMCLSAILC